jgi:hypothetical protein
MSALILKIGNQWRPYFKEQQRLELWLRMLLQSVMKIQGLRVRFSVEHITKVQTSMPI